MRESFATQGKKGSGKVVKTIFYTSGRSQNFVEVYQNKSSVVKVSIIKQVFIQEVVLKTGLRLTKTNSRLRK